jgi:hypothetical protein
MAKSSAFLKTLADSGTTSAVEIKRLKDKISTFTAANKDLVEQLDRAEKRVALRNCLTQAPELKPRQRGHGSKLREACPVIMVSDLHLEEVVHAASVNGLNTFDLKIAEQRMAKLAESIAWEIALERHAFEISRVILWFGGDIISGTIHEDLAESNLLSTPRAIIFAKKLLVRLVREVLALDVDVLCICNDGNHDRLTRKMRVQTRVDNSIGLVLYDSIAERFEDEKRIKFVMPDGLLTYATVFGRDLRFTHGDAIKSGGGIGGVTVPINKKLMQWDKSRTADHTFMGHWHTRLTNRRLSLNGSLIGYGPFSLLIGAEYEDPKQGFVLVDSKRGICHPKDLWVGQ